MFLKEVGPMHSQSKLQTNTRGKGEEHMSRDTNHAHTHTDTKSSPQPRQPQKMHTTNDKTEEQVTRQRNKCAHINSLASKGDRDGGRGEWVSRVAKNSDYGEQQIRLRCTLIYHAVKRAWRP